MSNQQQYMPPFEFEPEEVFYRRPAPLLQYLIIGTFSLSFAASLVAFFLSWILPITNPAWLPTWTMQLMERNQIALILLPLLCLCVCYWALRSITSDILACPERYLDERQKMLRDRVHRSAYKILRGVCFTVPIVTLLCGILWSTFLSSSPSVQSSSSSIGNMFSEPAPVFSVYNKSGNLLAVLANTALATVIRDPSGNFWFAERSEAALPTYFVVLSSIDSISQDNSGHLWFTERTDTDLSTRFVFGSNIGIFSAKNISKEQTTTAEEAFAVIRPVLLHVPIATTQPTSWQHDPVQLSLLFGTFFLNIFLLVSALPMILLACKEKE